VASRAAELRSAAGKAHLFELAEQDDVIGSLYAEHLEHSDNIDIKQHYQSIISERAAMAARVMIEQSDVVIGVWDGTTRGMIGGTRDTIAAALDLGVPVIWINATQPHYWGILSAPEMLIALPHTVQDDREAILRAIIADALCPAPIVWSDVGLKERWRSRSNPLFQAYRRIESLFGDERGDRRLSLAQTYESPNHIAAGSGAPLLAAAAALPDVDPALVAAIAKTVMRPFAWADGVSTYLSDAYRGGMVTSFFLSAFAIIGGIAYMPFATVDEKWGFALFELCLLTAIVAITFVGRRRHWHARWFETRRVAEYLRHAPFMLLLGVARSSGRWPTGQLTAWPEWYAMHTLGSIGLPRRAITPAYLSGFLAFMRDHHVVPQRDYHRDKSARLKRTQRRLDRLSEWFFVLAVISVAAYLLLAAGVSIGLLTHNVAHDTAKAFTFLGVLFPTFGGAFAGVHYFGDFDRFAAISTVASQKLDIVAARLAVLEGAEGQLTFGHVADIAHAIDDIVVTEIESWQAVFAAKHITVPV
jgi:hypothetical protein